MKELNLLNHTYNLLTVIEFDHKDDKTSMNYWICQCSCGTKTIVSTHNLRTGSVKSCGCLSKIRAANRRDNLLGRKFGKLTVVDCFYKQENSTMYWISKCDCGSDKKIKCVGADLKSGKVKSCSCARRLSYGEGAFNRLYDTYSRRARDKNILFDITKEEFKKLTKMNCFYCGIEPKQIAGRTSKKGYGEYVYNGLDKVDPSGGYTLDNCVPCCGQCNVAKNDYSKDEFYSWLKRVFDNLNLK